MGPIHIDLGDTHGRDSRWPRMKTIFRENKYGIIGTSHQEVKTFNTSLFVVDCGKYFRLF